MTDAAVDFEIGGATLRGSKMWYMLESEIVAMSGSALALSWAAAIPGVETAVYTRYFDGVDQSSPWRGVDGGIDHNASPSNSQWDNAESFQSGDMGVSGHVHQKGSAGSSSGSMNDSFSTDFNDATTSGSYAGGVRAFASAGSVQTSCTFTYTGGGSHPSACSGGVLAPATGQPIVRGLEMGDFNLTNASMNGALVA